MRWWLPCSLSCVGSVILAFLWVWLVKAGPLADRERGLQFLLYPHLEPSGPASAAPAAPPVLYVTIRDISDQPWPWPPLDYAILTHSLIPLFPRVVAFEHLPPAGDFGPEPIYTRQLTSQLDRLNQVVAPITLFSSGPQSNPLPRGFFSVATVGNVQALPPYAVGRWPDSAYAAYPAGVVAFRNEGDNRVHRAPLVYRFRDRFLPSLALEAYCRHRQADWHYSGVVLGRHVLLRDGEGREIERIPIDAGGCLTLLPSRQGRGPDDSVEFYSVILAAEQRRHGTTQGLDLGRFRNSLVVVGRDAHEAHQPLRTVLGTLSAGELTAAVLEQLVRQRWLRPLAAYELIVLALVAGAGATGLALIHRWQIGNLALPAGWGAIAALCLLGIGQGIWLSPLCLLPAWGGGWLIGWMWRDLFMGQNRSESTLWYRDQSELPF